MNSNIIFIIFKFNIAVKIAILELRIPREETESFLDIAVVQFFRRIHQISRYTELNNYYHFQQKNIEN